MAQTILVADDDPLTHRVLQRYLERAGYQMLSAQNGREALKIAKRELPQLIILDVVMPEMDGLTTLRHLKKSKATKAIPVIVLTIKADLVSKQETALPQPTLFLAKPISATQLLSAIKRLIPNEKRA